MAEEMRSIRVALDIETNKRSIHEVVEADSLTEAIAALQDIAEDFGL